MRAEDLVNRKSTTAPIQESLAQRMLFANPRAILRPLGAALEVRCVPNSGWNIVRGASHNDE